MLVDFLYSHPTWQIGLLVIGFITGLSLAGLYIFHRLVDVHMRHKDTETVGLTYAIVAVVYAVLIAFIVVDVFETASKGDEIATAEANKLSNMMIDSAGLPAQAAEPVRADLVKYIDIVVQQEWPSQQAGKTGEKVYEPGWNTIAGLSKRIAEFEPSTMGQTASKGEMLRVVNDLVKARRARILAAAEHLPDVVWQILLISGMVAIFYTYLFGARSFRIHMAITGLISATIALVFVLIIALDYPFRGEVSVGNEAFVNVKATAFQATAPESAKLEIKR